MRNVRRLVRLFTIAIAVVALLSLLRWAEGLVGGGGFFSGVATGLLLVAVAYFLLVRRADKEVAKIRKEKRARLPDAEVPERGTAVYGWQLRRLDGTPFEMNEARCEVVFLNFWSTMCLPCVQELASIERLHNKLAPEGVVFLCVATGDDLDELRQWAAKHGVSVPVFALAPDDVPAVFDCEYLPTTYIVAGDGRIALQHEGAAQWDHPRMVAFLRGLLAENVVAPPSVSDGTQGGREFS